MNKYLKIGKRMIALFMIVFMMANTYATSASYDGTSFITKAEFDDLINNFNNKMNEYQSGLNAKIDTAISSYLAGLSSESRVSQSSLINQSNYKFTNSWSLYSGTNKSQLGNKMMYSYFLCYLVAMPWSDNATGLYDVGGHHSDYPKYGTIGSSNSKYVVYSKSNWNNSYKVVDYLMESYPVSDCALLYCNTWLNWTNGSDMRGFSTDVVSSTADTWTSETHTNSGYVFGLSASVSGYKGFNTKDSITTPPSINYVSGNSVPTGDKIYAVNNEEINKKMTTYRSNMVGYCGYGYYQSRKYDSTYVTNWNSNDHPDISKAYKIAGYDHKYTEIPADTGYKEFILDSVSMLVDEPVRYYSGLPLFKATENGTVEMKLEFTNTENADTNWQIQKDIFDVNGAITVGLGTLPNGYTEYTDDAGNIIRNRYVVPSGKVQTIKFDVNRGETYWIKAEPASGLTRITSEQIDIVK